MNKLVLFREKTSVLRPSTDQGDLMEHRGYDLFHMPDRDRHELSFAYSI
jgi:hypothetical protein